MALISVKNDSTKAMAIYVFLNEFNNLENLIKGRFYKLAIEAVDDEKNRLYFYYGGLAGRISLEYDSDILEFKNEIKFKPNEKFKKFTLNQILGLLRKSSFKQCFPQNIDSVVHKTQQHDFLGSVKRLISMRNKLVHELVQLKFRNEDFIELLPKNILEEKLDIQFDEKSDEADQIQIILSNVVYINMLNDEIENKSKGLKDTVMSN
ncbi:MAG: hypothetical protein ACOX2V_04140 [Clostridia bacterium]|jgi:hypothetical protein